MFSGKIDDVWSDEIFELIRALSYYVWTHITGSYYVSNYWLLFIFIIDRSQRDFYQSNDANEKNNKGIDSFKTSFSKTSGVVALQTGLTNVQTVNVEVRSLLDCLIDLEYVIGVGWLNSKTFSLTAHQKFFFLTFIKIRVWWVKQEKMSNDDLVCAVLPKKSKVVSNEIS